MRKSLVKDVNFNDLKVFDRITDDNVDLLLEEITNLEKDNLLDIPRDAKVVSDSLSIVNKLEHIGLSSKTKKENLEIVHGLLK
ncbi:hypothetical protein HP397_06845, partial [Streptobacillus felis]